MKRFLIILLPLVGLSCSNTLTNSEAEYSFTTKMVDYSFQDLSPEVRERIAGFYSISGFTSTNEERTITLSDQLTDIVFAVDANGDPLLVSEADGNSLIFSPSETALTLTGLFGTDFISDVREIVYEDINSHPKFNRIVELIDQSLIAGSSFISKPEVFALIEEVHSHLKQKYYNSKPAANPVELNTTGNNFYVQNNSKLPYVVTEQHLVSDSSVNISMLYGKKLNSETDRRTKSTSFKVHLKEGANLVSVFNDLNAEKERYKKTSKDLILKFQKVLKLEQYSYNELNNTIHTLFNRNEISERSTEENHKLYVLNTLKENASDIVSYLSSQLNEFIPQNSETIYFLDLLKEILISQGSNAIIFSDDAYYKDLDVNADFSTKKEICIRNEEPVLCKIASEEITYSVGTAGCRESEIEIKFGSKFYAPFGLDSGSKLKIEWEYENGRSGFWLVSYSNSKEKVSGLNSTVGCFNFGNKETLILREQVIDHLGNQGNISSIEIRKPKMKSSSDNSFEESALLVSN